MKLIYRKDPLHFSSSTKMKTHISVDHIRLYFISILMKILNSYILRLQNKMILCSSDKTCQNIVIKLELWKECSLAPQAVLIKRKIIVWIKFNRVNGTTVHGPGNVILKELTIGFQTLRCVLVQWIIRIRFQQKKL